MPLVERDLEIAIEDIRETIDWLIALATSGERCDHKEAASRRAMAVHAMNRIRVYAKQQHA